MKKSGLVAVGAATGAGIATVASGSALAPIAGAAAGGFITDAVTEVVDSPAARIIHKAPDNLWTVAQKAVELGGFGLLLLFLGPVLIGWILPGPTQLNRQKKSGK
jgi:hypothetical protein